MKKILLITRCSRSQFLPDIWKSIKRNTIHLKDRSFVWHIAFDSNRIDMTKELRFLLIGFQQDVKELHNIEFGYSYSSSNNEMYGANIANDVIAKYHGKVDYAYLLDDDNILHPNFYIPCNEIESEIYLFGQTRLNKENETYENVIPDGVTSDNVLQWMDSAQFILPMEFIPNGYELGYCIDGLTLRKLLSEGKPKKENKNVYAYYNACTELTGLLLLDEMYS